MHVLNFFVLTLALAGGFMLLRQLFAGFAAQSPADYAHTVPAFDPRVHLCGPLLCEGVSYGPFGRVTSRFVAKMTGSWDGNHGTLREEFLYDNGVVQNREWRLELDEHGTLHAEANDVPGGGLGRVSGSTVKLGYIIRLPATAGGHVLRVIDWMYLCENGTIMNRSQFRKFGILMAELVATIRPVTA
jgi:hypothetical protein